MQEIFYEESATLQNQKNEVVKFTIFNVLSILFFVFLGAWLFLVVFGYVLTSNILLDIIFIIIPCASFIALGILFTKIKNRYCNDYDYTFISGTVRISKVIRNVKRRFIIEFATKEIEKLGKINSHTYEKFEKYPNIKKLILTSNNTPSENKDFYYIVIHNCGEKKLLVIECTNNFIINILRFSNKSILDDEFLREISHK